jgi:hypothetical protein
MMYGTQELAKELGVRQSTVVRWTQRGAPHRRDRRGHLWIHGHLFASWVESQRRSRSRRRVSIDQAYCLHCNKLVNMHNPRPRRIGNMILLSARCPECGAKVNRGSTDDQSR